MHKLRMVDSKYTPPRWSTRLSFARAVAPWLIAFGALLYSCAVKADEVVTHCEVGEMVYDPESQSLACMEFPKHPATGCTNRSPIKRNQAAVREFKKANPCPATHRRGTGPCPGYVVDHIWPLCAGGCDVPENMQYQKYQESRDKDRVERWMCGKEKRP